MLTALICWSRLWGCMGCVYTLTRCQHAVVKAFLSFPVQSLFFLPSSLPACPPAFQSFLPALTPSFFLSFNFLPSYLPSFFPPSLPPFLSPSLFLSFFLCVFLSSPVGNIIICGSCWLQLYLYVDCVCTNWMCLSRQLEKGTHPAHSVQF